MSLPIFPELPSLSDLSGLSLLPIMDSTPCPLTFFAAAEGVVVTACRPDVTQVIIPGEAGGVPVVRIGARAFAGHPHLLSVSLPDTVQTIGEEAFRGCSALMTVTAGHALTSVEAGAFRDCVNLQEVRFPTRPQAAQDAFAGCYQLEAAREPVTYR